jgi:hypothetical protein
MATETIGTVAYLKVNNQADAGVDFTLFGLLPTGGTNAEIFFVWWTPAERDPATAADWILRNAQISLLRDAFIDKLPVIVFHDDNSAFVTSVQIGTTG